MCSELFVFDEFNRPRLTGLFSDIRICDQVVGFHPGYRPDRTIATLCVYVLFLAKTAKSKKPLGRYGFDSKHSVDFPSVVFDMDD